METEFLHLAAALGLGLLVGLQREYAESRIAGIRTFPLITIFGTIIGWMCVRTGTYWLIAAGFVGLAIMLASANLIQRKSTSISLGQTTEIAVLVMFGVGAYIPLADRMFLPVTVGALVAILLYSKHYLEPMVDKMGKKDLTAIMQFVAISLVILPILPDRTFGPFDVFNPHDIWLMVVLIVGLGVVGYFIYKIFGDRVGTLSSGILGGLISSTATTVTFAKRSAQSKNIGKVAAFIITTATAIAFIRILVEVGVVSPGNLGYISPPIVAVAIFNILVCVGLYWKISQKEEQLDPPDNPAQLKSALIFGGLYAIILFAVAVAEEYLGQKGLYAVAVVSGLTDVDAITLSVANRLNSGSIAVELGWKLILIAALSNLVFKGGMAVVLGSKSLRKWIIMAFGAILVAGLLVLWLWPEGWHLTGDILENMDTLGNENVEDTMENSGDTNQE